MPIWKEHKVGPFESKGSYRNWKLDGHSTNWFIRTTNLPFETFWYRQAIYFDLKVNEGVVSPQFSDFITPGKVAKKGLHFTNVDFWDGPLWGDSEPTFSQYPKGEFEDPKRKMELEFLNLGKLDERYCIFTYMKTHKIHHVM